MKKWCLFLLVASGIASCTTSDDSDDSIGGSSDSFNRKEILANWADNYIIPAYEQYKIDVVALETATTTFRTTPSEANLATLRTKWLEAYLEWQNVAFLEIGKAEEIELLGYTNTFPTNTIDIEARVSSGTYDLTSLISKDEQGFPAIDYLINGLDGTDAEIVAFYTGTDADKYKKYLGDITAQLVSNTTAVVTDWKGTYRNTFVDNSGNNVNSALNKLINDYVFYYEKHFRAGKIGIPAGKFASAATVFPDKIEGYYKGDISKELFDTGLNAMQDFFNGVTYVDAKDSTGLDDYLQYLNTIKSGTALSTVINNQFDAARTTANSKLSDDFADEVNNSTVDMLTVYDELQKNVVHLKVDMLQAFNVNIDYVDGDGD